MSDWKPVVLHSGANPTVRRLLRMRDNRARRKAGRVIVDGWKEVTQAVQAGLVPCGFYVSEDDQLAAAVNSEPLVIGGKDVTKQVTLVSKPLMAKISYGQSPRGVVAEFEAPERSLACIDLPHVPLVLVLDQVEKPGNVGAVFRCADAAGVDAVLLCESCDLFNPNVIRSSLGAVFHVPAAQGEMTQVAEFCHHHGLQLMAARTESSRPLWAADLSGPVAIVLGSEANGLGQRWQHQGGSPVEGIRIPMDGQVDSLNVSVSAAVIAFEARRQRGELKTG